MHELDLRFVIHNLSIKKGVTPIKQPQRCFRPKLILETEKKAKQTH